MSTHIEMPTATVSPLTGGEGMSAENIISALKMATPAQLAAISQLLALEAAAKPAAKPVAAKLVAKPVAAKLVAKPVAAKKVAKPVTPADSDAEEAEEADEGDKPTPESYRLAGHDADLCLARKEPPQGSDKDGWDKRWSPSVYYERQCKNKPEDGEEICAGCAATKAKEEETGKFKKWHGVVTEDPPAWTHMLGTEWAAKCTWGSAPKAASPAKGPSPAKAAKALDAAAKKAQKEADKEAAKAEKEAAAAAKKAEKEAAAAAKKAEKAVKPKKEKAEKAEKAEAETEEKEKEKPKKAKAKPVETKAAVEVPATPAFTVEQVDKEDFAIKNGYAYAYNMETGKVGDYMGKLTGERGSWEIDVTVEEPTESDAE